MEASARRILEAKARLGLHRTRTINLEAVPLSVGGRKHDAVARAISERAITLVKDARNQVPLPLPRTGSLLYLSVLDYPSGWRIAAPSRTMIPELRSRWPNIEAIEVSDRTTPAELDLVRAMAEQLRCHRRRHLRPRVVRRAAVSIWRRRWFACCRTCRAQRAASQPLVAAFFGNPYTPMFVPELPAMLLTYDFSDYAEQSAVKAIAGEIPIGGKLPITLPGLFPLGHGLTRGAALQ